MRTASLRTKTSAAAIILSVATITLLSCALFLPRSLVVKRPSPLHPMGGKRPLIYARILPGSYADMIAHVETPDGGGAYLTVGQAIASSYVSALGAYFTVYTRTSKGVGQYAFIEMDKFTITSSARPLEPHGGLKRAHMTMRLVHSIRIESYYRDVLGTVPIDVSVEEVLTYHDRKDFTQKAAKLAGTLLVRAEEAIFEHLMLNPSGSKYITDM